MDTMIDELRNCELNVSKIYSMDFSESNYIQDIFNINYTILSLFKIIIKKLYYWFF